MPIYISYTHTRARTGTYRINTPRVCTDAGPPPPGNNSKSRVINPSLVSSFPTPLSFSLPVCPYAYVFALMHPLLFLHLSISLSIRNQFLPRTHGCACTSITHPPRLRNGYTCMTCIVVNCSHAAACSYWVNRGPPWTLLNSVPSLARREPETRLNVRRTTARFLGCGDFPSFLFV